jgi:hypothetical protein
MTTLAMTTVGRSDDRTLTAECWVCGLYLEQVPGIDVQAALRAFRTCHPMTAGAPHAQRLPDGWRAPLYGPGALSQ